MFLQFFLDSVVNSLNLSFENLHKIFVIGSFRFSTYAPIGDTIHNHLTKMFDNSDFNAAKFRK